MLQPVSERTHSSLLNSRVFFLTFLINPFNVVYTQLRYGKSISKPICKPRTYPSIVILIEVICHMCTYTLKSQCEFVH